MTIAVAMLSAVIMPTLPTVSVSPVIMVVITMTPVIVMITAVVISIANHWGRRVIYSRCSIVNPSGRWIVNYWRRCITIAPYVNAKTKIVSCLN
jgi:hypothetical protein